MRAISEMNKDKGDIKKEVVFFLVCNQCETGQKA